MSYTVYQEVGDKRGRRWVKITRKASIFVKESVLWKSCQVKPGWVLGDTIKVKGVNDFSFLCAKVYLYICHFCSDI